MSSILGLLVAVGAMVVSVAGHGFLLDPPGRPYLRYLSHRYYWAHGVRSGGKFAVSENGTHFWPEGRHGICGQSVTTENSTPDALYPFNDWDTPGEVQATYREGSSIKVDVLVAQNHLGRFRVRVCPLSATDEKDCTELKMANKDKYHFDLPFMKGWVGNLNGYHKPDEESDEFSLYPMAPVGKEKGCADWACDQFIDMYVYSTEWQLPEGFSCDHCKLQWYWLTASSCWPPCLEDDPSKCHNPMPYEYCGEEGSDYPEEFWNCADISIGSGRKSHGSYSISASHSSSPSPSKDAPPSSPDANWHVGSSPHWNKDTSTSPAPSPSPKYEGSPSPGWQGSQQSPASSPSPAGSQGSQQSPTPSPSPAGSQGSQQSPTPSPSPAGSQGSQQSPTPSPSSSGSQGSQQSPAPSPSPAGSQGSQGSQQSPPPTQEPPAYGGKQPQEPSGPSKWTEPPSPSPSPVPYRTQPGSPSSSPASSQGGTGTGWQSTAGSSPSSPAPSSSQKGSSSQEDTSKAPPPQRWTGEGGRSWSGRKLAAARRMGRVAGQ